MKGILLLNGEPPEEKIRVEKDDFVACCDGAYRWAMDKAGRVDLLTGDFDSLGCVPENGVRYPEEKNFTDGELALEKLLEAGLKEISIYGGGGGREDHLWGNIQLLYAARLRGAHAVMYTKTSEISCESGRFPIRGCKGRTFSLAPVGYEAHIMESSGVKYPLTDLTLRAGSCRGVSNVALSDEAEIFCDGGALFVFKIVSGKE